MNAQSQGDLRPNAWGQVFNLFRRRGSDLACAVALDRPVPTFIDARWAYYCEADAGCLVPGFDYATVASRSVRRGFSLFRAGCRTGRAVS